MRTTKSMIEYIATCSKISLESFLLARLNDRANLRKQAIEIFDELIENDVQARISEWILVRRRQLEQLCAEQAEEMRRPPQHARRNTALKGCGIAPGLPEGNLAAALEGTDIGGNEVIALLRDAVPAEGRQRGAAGAVPAPGSERRQISPAARQSAVAGKSKRIA